jgi:antitoxin HigA-1
LGLTVTKGAEALGVSRPALSNLLNGRAGISPEMAIRLEKAYGSNADTWMRIQASYELAEARKHEKEIRVTRLDRAHAATQ